MPLTLTKHFKCILFTIQTCFMLKLANLNFFVRKKTNLKQIGNFVQLLGDGRRVEKKPHFSRSPLLWTSFRLINMAKRMTKMNFATKKAYFPTNRVIKEHFCFPRMCTSQNFDFLLPNLFRSFSLALFFFFSFLLH